MRKAEKEKPEADRNSFAKIGWGTEVQYLNADMTPAGEPMPLAEANALKPEWKVVFKEIDVDGKKKTRIEVIMDTSTTKAQLDALKEAVTKNIDCPPEKKGKDGKDGVDGVDGKDGKEGTKEGEQEEGDKESEEKGDKDNKDVPAPVENAVEKRKENEQKLLNEVVKSLSLSKKEIHWKWLQHRIGNYYNNPKQLFHPAEDGISVVVSDRTMWGSNNGRNKEVVLTGDKLKELGISQTEALDILNSDVREEEYRRGVAILRYAKRDAERKGEELPTEFDINATTGNVDKPAEATTATLTPKEQRQKNREERRIKRNNITSTPTSTPQKDQKKKEEFGDI